MWGLAGLVKILMIQQWERSVWICAGFYSLHRRRSRFGPIKKAFDLFGIDISLFPVSGSFLELRLHIEWILLLDRCASRTRWQHLNSVPRFTGTYYRQWAVPCLDDLSETRKGGTAFTLWEHRLEARLIFVQCKQFKNLAENLISNIWKKQLMASAYKTSTICQVLFHVRVSPRNTKLHLAYSSWRCCEL